MKGILKIEIELTSEILGEEKSSEDMRELITDEILAQLDFIDGSNIYSYVDFED